MSDPVVLALIAMASKAWADLVVLLTSATGVSTVGFILVIAKQWWDGRRAKEAAEAAKGAREVAIESRAELSAKLDENTHLTHVVKEAATRSKHEVTQAFQAGERSGYVGGIVEGKRQATGPAELSGK